MHLEAQPLNQADNGSHFGATPRRQRDAIVGWFEWLGGSLYTLFRTIFAWWCVIVVLILLWHIKVRPPMGGVSYSFAVAVPVPGEQGRGQGRACWVHRAGALVLLRSSTRWGGCRHADVNPSRTIYTSTVASRSRKRIPGRIRTRRYPRITPAPARKTLETIGPDPGTPAVPPAGPGPIYTQSPRRRVPRFALKNHGAGRLAPRAVTGPTSGPRSVV